MRPTESRSSSARDSRATADGAVLELIVRLISYIIYMFTLAIVVRAVISFLPYFTRPPYHPFVVQVDRIVTQVTEPVLAPIRRMLPSFGGLDFSPMVVIIILFIIREVLDSLS